MAVQFLFNNSTWALLVYALSCSCLNYCNEKLLTEPQLFLMFLDSICFLFMILFEDLLLFNNTHKKEKIAAKMIITRKTTSKITIIQKQKNSAEKYSVLIILLTGIMTSLISSLNYFILYLSISGFISIYCFLYIICSWVVLRLWFKNKMHRHHVLAIGIILFGFCLSVFETNLIVITNIFVNNHSYFVLIGALIGISILVSGREIFEKYIIDILFISQYRLLFYEGIISLIIAFICFAVMQIFHCKEASDVMFKIIVFCKKSSIEYIQNSALTLFGYSSIMTLYAWLYIISTIIANMFRLAINKQLGPTHRYSMDLIALSLYTLFSYVRNSNEFRWINLIVTIVLIIGCLIYNENIRIPLFGLANNTKVEIQKRAKEDATSKELNSLEDIIDEIEQDEDEL